MSTQGHSGGSGDQAPEHHSEFKQASEKHDPGEKSAAKVGAELSKQDRQSLVERTKDERNPETRLSQKTAGRGTFGECGIADVKICGQNKSTAVELKNGLPEKIETPTQDWQRDAKNPQVWHIQEGHEKFDLKADVRLQGDDIRAKVKYENGRQVTFTNGEPSEINHPNGEKWAADPKHPGTWDVTAPNHENPSHPKHFTIQDVKVNAKDGDITWHVDRGAGKGHDREIDGHNQYHDSKKGVYQIQGERSSEIRHESSHLQNQHEAPAQAKVEHAPPEPIHQSAAHIEVASPILQTPLKAELPAQVQKVAPEADALMPQPAAPAQARVEHALPEPIHQGATHIEAPSPILQTPLKAELPPQAQMQAAPRIDAPLPQPTAPPLRQFEQPSPAHPPEQQAFVPTPHLQKFQEIAPPQPLAAPKDSISDFQRQNQQMMENNLKSMQERSEKARAEAIHMLPKVAESAMAIPQLSDTAASRAPYAFPVPRAGVLSPQSEAPLPTMSRPESLLQPQPTMRPLDSLVSHPAPQPLLQKSESYVFAAPAPVPIEPHMSNSASAPVPVEMRQHNVQNTDAPAPVRATGMRGPIVEVTPSIPKPEPEPVRAEKAESLPPAAHTANSDMQRNSVPAPRNDQPPSHKQTKLEGMVKYKSEQQSDQQQSSDSPTQPAQIQPAQTPHVFKFTATANAAREHSVYDDGPQMVQDSTQKIQLHAGATDQGHPSLHGKAAAGDRAEQNAFYDGSDNVQLVGVDHKVPITVSGVTANQDHYQATLNSPALGRDGRPLSNQVTWVSGKIEGGSFHIEQASINNGKPFATMGVLRLKQRR